MSRFPLLLFLTCTTRPSRASCLLLPANFPFLVLIGSPILLPLVLLFPPQKSRSPRPTDWKKGGADITASPSIFMALLICCSARNNAHVGDLYPASSNSSCGSCKEGVVVQKPSIALWSEGSYSWSTCVRLLPQSTRK